MVFQDYALFPHLSVADIVAYGVDTKKFSIDLVLSMILLGKLSRKKIKPDKLIKKNKENIFSMR